MGYGVIDGRGELPMLINGSASGMSWWDLARSAVSPLTQNNPRMLQVSNTDGFTLYKITLMNSPNFHVSLGNRQQFYGVGRQDHHAVRCAEHGRYRSGVFEQCHDHQLLHQRRRR